MKNQTSLKKRLLAGAMSAALLMGTGLVPFSSTPVSAATHEDYGEALELSLYFWDANQCGTGVDGNALTWRGNCHPQDGKVSLSTAQGLSSASKEAVKAANNGSDIVDISGGYHDAGDHIKFSNTIGFSISSLAWSYISYPSAYQDIGQVDHVKYILKYACDYFMKVTYLDSSNNVICYVDQVATEGEDHSTSGIWCPPEDASQFTRTTYWADASNPHADSAGDMAAALASTAIVFQDSDSAYAAQCLTYAKALSNFAAKYPSVGSVSARANMYNATSLKDDIAWGQLWVDIASNGGKLPSGYTPPITLTGDKAYSNGDYDGYLYCWDKVYSGYAALLCDMGYETSKYANELKVEINGQGGLSTTSYNGNGWGAARYNCALQMMALKSGDSGLAEAAAHNMDVILGQNSYGYSFLIGYGSKWPTHIHHRAANPGTGDPAANTSMTNTLYGALIGGMDSSGNYEDNQNSYQFTEPALDYNGCFVLACAGLYEKFGGSGTTADTVLTSATEVEFPHDYGMGSVVVDPTEPATSGSEDPTQAPTQPSTQAPTEPETQVPTQTEVVDGKVTKQSDMIYAIDVTDAIAVTVTANVGSGNYANGCIGYMNNGNWEQPVQYAETAGSDGLITVTADIPSGVTEIQFQIWSQNASSVTAELTYASVVEPTEPTTDEPTQAPTSGELDVTLWGDADVDGDCDIIDVICVNKDQLGSFTLTAQGVKNADVDQNGVMAFADAVNIMKSLVDLVVLPVNS
ncbi:MAG: glycoside hydrolase family 9 protein [Oscillospiraceae bacterium]|nr:glycoside hydrolase family 9 protein [Oscillospiraceae bacterium]